MATHFKKQQVIAVDYDGTFTADKELWTRFINDAMFMGHVVVCVTARAERPTDLPNIPIIMSGTDSKRACASSFGYKISIWIDDQPEKI